MKKKIAIMVFCLAAAVIAGCGQTGETAYAQAPSTIAVMPAEDDSVTVNAKASVSIVPDKAEVTVGVNSREKTAETAQQKNAEKVQKIIDTLIASGVEEKSIKTSRYNLWPEYDYTGKTQVLTGYSANTALTVSDQDIENVGKLLTAVVDAGADNVDSLRYFCSGYDEAYQEALQKAVEASAKKAETLAAAGGRELGTVMEITEGYQNTGSRYSAASAKMMNMAMEEAAAADMAVMPGETDIEATVTVTYRLN